MRFARSFGAFWYDFLVGDRPELFVGAIVVLALAWLAIEMGVDSAIAGGMLTVLLLGLGWVSLALATRRRG
jgi:ABC-type uncharacterized transport system permease subunit